MNNDEIIEKEVREDVKVIPKGDLYILMNKARADERAKNGWTNGFKAIELFKARQAERAKCLAELENRYKHNDLTHVQNEGLYYAIQTLKETK